MNLTQVISGWFRRSGDAPRTFTISERLGRGHEISDWEFICFTEGHMEELSPRQQRRLAVLFGRDPWHEKLLEIRARRRRHQEHGDEVVPTNIPEAASTAESTRITGAQLDLTTAVQHLLQLIREVREAGSQLASPAGVRGEAGFEEFEEELRTIEELLELRSRGLSLDKVRIMMRRINSRLGDATARIELLEASLADIENQLLQIQQPNNE